LFNIYHLIFGWASIAPLLANPTILLILQIIGLSLYVIGYIIYVAGRLQIKEWFAELWMPTKLGDGFTQTGLYSRIRHLLYLGSIIFSLGIILIFQTWLGLILYLYPLMMTIKTAYKEESPLLERFGKDYERYMKQTGRFFPKRFRKKDDEKNIKN